MFRLDGGPCTDSSTSRSCLRSRSSPGTRRESPAPAAVPVDRLVGIGLVRPWTLRPVAGVCDRVDSRPVPPTRRVVLALARTCRALPRAVADLLGLLALDAAERLVGADDLLLLGF